MIRFRLRELIADLEFRRGSRVKLEDVARDTGIHRTTLYKIGSKRGYNTTTENLSRLCRYFDRPLSDIAEYVRDEDVLTATSAATEVPSKGVRAPVRGKPVTKAKS